jgi:hypothetical protein
MGGMVFHAETQPSIFAFVPQRGGRRDGNSHYGAPTLLHRDGRPRNKSGDGHDDEKTHIGQNENCGWRTVGVDFGHAQRD